MKFKRLRVAALAAGLMFGGTVVATESPASAIQNCTGGRVCTFLQCRSVDGSVRIGNQIDAGYYARVLLYWYNFSAGQWQFFTVLADNTADANGWMQTPTESMVTSPYPGYYIAAYVQTWENGVYGGHWAQTADRSSYCYAHIA